MPIIIRHDAPLLIAGSSIGAGMFDQNQIAQQNQRADLNQAWGMAGDQLDDRRQGLAMTQRNDLAQDQVALDLYGQQRQQFNANRGFDMDQQQLNLRAQGQQFAQGQQLNAVSREQADRQAAIEQINRMAQAGFLDPAEAARLTGAAGLGGNPFTQPTGAERNAGDQVQFQNRLQLEQLQQQGQLEREAQRNATSLEREQLRQQEITRRGTAGGNGSQDRLRQNDELARAKDLAQAEIDAAEQDLADVNDTIKALASSFNPLKASSSANQSKLDELYAHKATLQAGVKAAKAKNVDRARAATQPTTRPAAQGAATPASAPVRINSESEFQNLPSGSVFIGPDGLQRRKP